MTKNRRLNLRTAATGQYRSGSDRVTTLANDLTDICDPSLPLPVTDLSAKIHLDWSASVPACQSRQPRRLRSSHYPRPLAEWRASYPC